MIIDVMRLFTSTFSESFEQLKREAQRRNLRPSSKSNLREEEPQVKLPTSHLCLMEEQSPLTLPPAMVEVSLPRT